MIAKFFYFVLGAMVTTAVLSPGVYEKLLIDVENTVYPLIECHSESLANLDDRFDS